ncbi:PDR/VanB family oxidoreductase [Nocardia harenae]|uniref:PDR/VanB family oxidoreductase n=1 Tax=Nocardia harenae TaxID=358707 RepID=UPI00082F0604|nr:PDR/VanB family oxidoreductase [Nocardia harenae]
MNDITVRVRARRDEAAGVFALDLADASGAPLPRWRPGAHIDVAAGPTGVRQYSLCGDPGDLGGWRIAILHEPGGRGGSDHLRRTALEGSLLQVSQPRNNFELVEAEEYLFVAGGIGITPILAMTTTAAAPWQLYYGGRSRAHMAFAGELAERHPAAVNLLPQDEHGLLPITELLDRHPRATVYCCGPEPLLAATVAAGTERGMPVHVERFAPKPVAEGADTAFEVRLASTGQTFAVPPGTSIADVLEAAGVPVITSCREGTCGTCETTVLTGAIEHRDSLLTEDEQAAGKTMMLCVSRACQGPLVLDL